MQNKDDLYNSIGTRNSNKIDESLSTKHYTIYGSVRTPFWSPRKMQFGCETYQQVSNR